MNFQWSDQLFGYTNYGEGSNIWNFPIRINLFIHLLGCFWIDEIQNFSVSNYDQYHCEFSYDTNYRKTAIRVAYLIAI